MIESINKESEGYKHVYGVPHKYVNDNEVMRYRDMLKKQRAYHKSKIIGFLIIFLILLCSGIGVQQIDVIPGDGVKEFVVKKQGDILAFP